MSASLDQLIPEFVDIAKGFVQDVGSAGYLPRVTSTLRTFAEQERLYRKYLSGMSPYPAAPPGTSAHEYGYAFDMVVSPMPALAYLGSVWQDMGGVWTPRDEIHFEYPGFQAPPPEQRHTGANPYLLGAADLWFGSTIATIAKAFGIGPTVLEEALSHPATAIDPYVQEIIKWMRDVGILYPRP